MAKNPQWRGSLAIWRARVGDWIQRSNPEDLLAVDIFFDIRGVAGEIDLVERLWREACGAAAGNVAFAKLLVESAGPVESGLNFFGGFRSRNGRVDVKRCGLFGIVSAARALAIRHHVLERATPARLAGIKALGIGGESDLDALAEAQAAFLDLLAAQQVADAAQGVPASNAVAVKALSSRDRERLRAALRAVVHLDTLVQDLLFAEPAQGG
jgi:DNA polymerase-3 subunit epsilon/CBS domain-containing protein